MTLGAVARYPVLLFGLTLLPAGEALAQLYDCSSTTTGNVCHITSATSVTMSTANNVTYAWDSGVAGAKMQNLNFTCASAGNGFTFTVKDERGTAAANPINVTPKTGSSDTIDTISSFTLNANFEAIVFQCDGGTNWLVE